MNNEPLITASADPIKPGFYGQMRNVCDWFRPAEIVRDDGRSMMLNCCRSGCGSYSVHRPMCLTCEGFLGTNQHAVDVAVSQLALV